MRRAISSAGGGGGSTDADDSDGRRGSGRAAKWHARRVPFGRATLSRVILHNGSVRTGRRAPSPGTRAGDRGRSHRRRRRRARGRPLDRLERARRPGRALRRSRLHGRARALPGVGALARPARSLGDALARRGARGRGERRAAERTAGWSAPAGARRAGPAATRNRTGRRSTRPAAIARCCSGRTITTPPGCRRRRSLCCRSATSPWSSATQRASPPACCVRPRPGRRPRPSRRPPSASSTRRSCAALRVAHARGVTGIHDFQRECGLAAWQRLHADRRLSLRVWASLPAERARRDHRARAAQRPRRRLAAHRPRQGVRGRHARLAHRVDAGAVRRRGARRGAAERGRAARPRRDAAPTRASSSRCTRSAMRPTGPCWTRWRRRASAGRRGGLRPRIEHAQLLHPDDLARFAELGVTASMQPSHAPSDRSLAEAVWGARCAGAYALGSLSASGARAVLRLRRADRAARPAGRRAGRRHARLAGRRGARGRARAGRLLERRRPRTPGRAPPRAGCCPGYAADLVVLERDPVTCPPDEIAGIGVVATMAAAAGCTAARPGELIPRRRVSAAA